MAPDDGNPGDQKEGLKRWWEGGDVFSGDPKRARVRKQPVSSCSQSPVPSSKGGRGRLA